MAMKWFESQLWQPRHCPLFNKILKALIGSHTVLQDFVLKSITFKGKFGFHAMLKFILFSVKMLFLATTLYSPG